MFFFNLQGGELRSYVYLHCPIVLQKRIHFRSMVHCVCTLDLNYNHCTMPFWKQKWGTKATDTAVLWIIITIYPDVCDVIKTGESECNLITWCVMWSNFFLLTLLIRIMTGTTFTSTVLEKLSTHAKSTLFNDKDL